MIEITNTQLEELKEFSLMVEATQKSLHLFTEQMDELQKEMDKKIEKFSIYDHTILNAHIMRQHELEDEIKSCRKELSEIHDRRISMKRDNTAATKSIPHRDHSRHASRHSWEHQSQNFGHKDSVRVGGKKKDLKNKKIQKSLLKEKLQK